MFRIIYTLLFALLFCASCHPLNRAAVTERKAERAVEKGKQDRAVGLLVQTARLNKEKLPSSYVKAAGLLFGQGEFKQAFRLIDKIPPCEGETNCSEMDRVLMQAWKGTVALQMGLGCQALALNREGLEYMDTHGLVNDSLRSVLWCNRAVGDIFCQGANAAPGEKIHFKNIHQRDFKRVLTYLAKACELDADNCTAAYNKVVVEAILSVPSRYWNHGYLPDSIYPQIHTPYFDCLPPEPEEPDSYSFNRLTEELAQKNELLLVLDISGSMSSTVVPPGSGQQPMSRITLLKAACDSLLTHIDARKTKVGAITIGGSCGREPLLEIPVGSISPEELNTLIQQLPLNGGTPLDERVLMGMDLFTASKSKNRALFLFSDGVGSCGQYRSNICGLGDELNQRDIQFYAFALLLEGTGSGREYGLLNCIAQSTQGLLLGVDDTAKVEDKRIDINQMPVSIPLFIDEIAAGEAQPFMQEEDLRTKADSLKAK